jgi:hypothetical protein
VTIVALRLKFLVEQSVPCELEESSITRPHSNIITRDVIDLARNAGGEEHKACVVSCLLVCKRWFKRQALHEMYDADLHDVRAVACEVIAKALIEGEEDQDYLFQEVR